MNKTFNKLLEKNKLINQKRKLYEELDKNELDKHKTDLILLKVTIFEKLKNEYLTNSDDILKITYEMNVGELKGGTHIILFYNNSGYRMNNETFIIDKRIDIDNDIKMTFPGITARFSAKQIISSSLNDENTIISFYISRDNFKKILDNTTLMKQNIHKTMSYI